MIHEGLLFQYHMKNDTWELLEEGYTPSPELESIFSRILRSQTQTYLDENL